MHFCICNVSNQHYLWYGQRHTKIYPSWSEEGGEEKKTTLSWDVIQQKHEHDYSFACHPSFYKPATLKQETVDSYQSYYKYKGLTFLCYQ